MNWENVREKARVVQFQKLVFYIEKPERCAVSTFPCNLNESI